MTSKRVLTDKVILSLKPAEKDERYEVYDAVIENFAVRVGSKTKSLSFILVARFGNSTSPTRRTIGKYPLMSLTQARDVAASWNALISKGIDPEMDAVRLRDEMALRNRSTFRSVMEDYLSAIPSRENNRHVVEDTKIIRRYVLDLKVNSWLAKPLNQVTDLDVAALIASIRDRPAPAVAYQVFGFIKTFFHWAISPERRLNFGLEYNPIVSVTPRHLGLVKRIRERVFTLDEIRAYWTTAEETAYPFGPFCQAVLLTGQRKSDVADAAWSEVDFKRRLWTIPAERYKSKSQQEIPLSRAMLLLLEELRDAQNEDHGDYIFSGSNGRRPMKTFSKPLEGFKQRMVAHLNEIAPGTIMKPWSIHDCRRTVRTQLAASKINKEIAEMVMGHGKEGLERIYNQHYYLLEKRKALAAWALRLASIVAGDPVPEDDDEDF